MVALCNKVWTRVENTLCVDSPEGRSDGEEDEDVIDAPDRQADDQDGNTVPGPNDRHSYSWRALRETR